MVSDCSIYRPVSVSLQYEAQTTTTFLLNMSFALHQELSMISWSLPCYPCTFFQALSIPVTFVYKDPSKMLSKQLGNLIEELAHHYFLVNFYTFVYLLIRFIV